MSSFGLKLEMALQTFRGLRRRLKHYEQTVDFSVKHIESLRTEAARKLETATVLETELVQQRQSLQDLREYTDEVAGNVERLYWQTNPPRLDDLSSDQKAQIYSDFLKKNRIGDGK